MSGTEKKLELEQVKGDPEYQGDAFEIAMVSVNVIRKLTNPRRK